MFISGHYLFDQSGAALPLLLPSQLSEQLCETFMLQLISSAAGARTSSQSFAMSYQALCLPNINAMNGLLTPIARRLKRMRRRRKVGRAYDMSLEITRILKAGDRVLDVGCGNGFIAHHLNSLLGQRVVGLDVSESTSARINYLPYDGQHFPVLDSTFDAVLLCYVLHHASDPGIVLKEVHRVLRPNGTVIVYEDNPSCWWDKAVCWVHNQQWKGRTGDCTFQLRHEWDQVFSNTGFKVLKERSLSRWRNLAHPVSRSFFVLEAEQSVAEASRLETWSQAEQRAA